MIQAGRDNKGNDLAVSFSTKKLLDLSVDAVVQYIAHRLFPSVFIYSR